MEDVIGNKRVTNASPPNFITVKNREIFDKTEIVETFNNYFVTTGPNLAASFPESKTIFQNYIHYDDPCLSTINLTDLELKNTFASLQKTKVQGMPMLSKKVFDEIFVILEIYFKYLYSKGSHPR